MTTSPDQPPPDALETRLRAELAELMAVGAEVLHTLTIQEWLGHRNIQHTTRYTELTTKRFKDFWQKED